MKNYYKFVQKLNEEDLQQVKQDIADKVAAEQSKNPKNKQSFNNKEIDEKPNDAIIDDIKKEIENYEKQKVAVNNRIEEINKKIEIFSGQSKISRDSKQQAELNKKIQSLQDSLTDLVDELKKFDDLIAQSTERQQKLKDINKISSK